MVALDKKPCKMDKYRDVCSDVCIIFVGCIPSGYSTKVMQGYNL
mgnify:CR=1 FL=1